MAIDRLRAEYGRLVVSRVYESNPVGFEGDRFFNLVIGLDTPHLPGAVVRTLRAIEDQSNRTRGGARYSSRTLDLDLLLYDDLIIREGGMNIPRGEILQHAFVLRPLAEIAGDRHHPIERRTFAQLWAEFDNTEQDIWVVPFDTLVDDNGGKPTP